ncbi:protein FAM161A isoform X2 [Erpetoichthys calabaricus]|uniref:protein FAM161A isoform X2 n=1 Tax=Erpetoichthys calabaricus TaxID=27687 RepID=UPI002234E6AD|nr:protein FAM161A isoform X2 [Erpetoichthys calabaricus]
MDDLHRASVLVTSCFKTPVHPQTKTPVALYERKKVCKACSCFQESLHNMRDHEKENKCQHYLDVEDSKNYLTSSKNYRPVQSHLDIRKMLISNEEYYRKLEELKNAHLDTMAQLEGMYKSKLKLREEVQDSDTEEAELNYRQEWKTQNQITICEKNYLDNETHYSHCSSYSDVSDVVVIDIEAENNEKGVLLSPREHIKSMWDDFSIHDYIAHEKLRAQLSPKRHKIKGKSKEWSPAITIPEPFQMTVREDKKKKKNIKSRSEIELENFMLKKQMEELMECQKKFKANPVPAHVFLPLYEELTERNEERRQFVKERSRELLLASQKPFTFIEREAKKKETRKTQLKVLMVKKKKSTFKAKPVPKSIYDSAFNDRLEEEELYREIRMQMRAQELLYSSSLPKNMINQLTSKKRKVKGGENEKEFEFQPKITADVPDFEAKYRKFQKQMMKMKDIKPVTVCEPFKLRTSMIQSNREKILADIEAEESKRGDSRWPYITSTKQTKLEYSSANSSLCGSQELCPAKATETCRRRQEAIRNSLEEKKKLEDEENKRRAKQKQRMKMLQKIIAKRAHANDPLQSLARISELKVKQFRKQERQRRKEYLEELKEIQERVKERPLLLEQVAKRNATMAAEKHYAETLKHHGLSEDFLHSKVARVLKVFNDSLMEHEQSFPKDSSKEIPEAYVYTEYPDDYEDFDENDDKEINHKVLHHSENDDSEREDAIIDHYKESDNDDPQYDN